MGPIACVCPFNAYLSGSEKATACIICGEGLERWQTSTAPDDAGVDAILARSVMRRCYAARELVEQKETDGERAGVALAAELARAVAVVAPAALALERHQAQGPVSYTHLTLPTSDLV